MNMYVEVVCVCLCVEGVQCHYWSYSSSVCLKWAKEMHHTVFFYLKHIATLWNLMTHKIKYDTQDLMRASLKKTQRWGLGFLRGRPGPRARTGELWETAGELEELGWRGCERGGGGWLDQGLVLSGPSEGSIPYLQIYWGGGAFALPPSLFCSGPPSTLSLPVSVSVSLPFWSC